MRVHWSNKALRQLAEIAERLQRQSAAAADRVENELIEASQKLENFPHLGRKVPESNFEQVRELFVGIYRLVYTVGDFQVEIIAVVHQAQRR